MNERKIIVGGVYTRMTLGLCLALSPLSILVANNPVGPELNPESTPISSECGDSAGNHTAEKIR